MEQSITAEKIKLRDTNVYRGLGRYATIGRESNGQPITERAVEIKEINLRNQAVKAINSFNDVVGVFSPESPEFIKVSGELSSSLGALRPQRVSEAFVLAFAERGIDRTAREQASEANLRALEATWAFNEAVVTLPTDSLEYQKIEQEYHEAVAELSPEQLKIFYGIVRAARRENNSQEEVA